MSASPRAYFERCYQSLHRDFCQHAVVKSFMSEFPDRQLALELARNVCKAHLRSPQILSFIYAVTPPGSSQHVKENLLEELGLHDEHESHPDLLRKLGRAIGYSAAEWDAIELDADLVIKNRGKDPIMFQTMAEQGFNVMLEVFAFEWFLARESGNFGRQLKSSLGLSSEDLEWFFHHSEVDIAHAEQGLDTLAELVSYYEFDAYTVQNVTEITLRDNIFLKRYFDLQCVTNFG